MSRLTDQFITEMRGVLASLNYEYAELRASSSSGNSIALSGDQIDSISAGVVGGGSVRVFDRGNWIFVSFNSFDEIAGIKSKLESYSKPLLGLSSVKLAKGKPSAIKKITGQKVPLDSISFDEKMELAKRYNAILRSHPSIQSSRSVYRDTISTYLYLNSEGSELLYDKAHCGISLSSTARDGGEIQPYHESIAGYGGYELVNAQDQTAEKVVRTAVDLLKAEDVSGGRYNVIVDQRLSGVFIHEAFGHLSEADGIYENERMLSIMKLGERFGVDELNVIDDGTIENQTGYIPMDDEGILPGKSYLIKNGILSGRLHSRETAAKMNELPTGNARAISVMHQPIVRMTNTYIDNGRYSKEEIFDSVKDGIYAQNYHGGMTNLEMFTFSAVCGYEVKKGKQGRLLKNVMLSGNVFDTLKNISMIGNDGVLYGGLGGCGKGGQSPLPVSLGGPHMLITDVLIGGK